MSGNYGDVELLPKRERVVIFPSASYEKLFLYILFVLFPPPHALFARKEK
jgi:hypothetical protein